VFHKFGLDLGSRVSKAPSDYSLANLSIPGSQDLAFMMEYEQLAPDALTQQEMEALIEAFDARISKAARKTGYPKSMIDDLLYLIRYGWRDLLIEEDQGDPERMPPSDFEAFLRMKPRRSDHLAVSTFQEFAPLSNGEAEQKWVKKGKILYFYNVTEGTFGGLGGEGDTLLSLCDGLKTVEQVCRDFASGGDGKKLFFRAAQLIKNLYRIGLIDL
jgi:hypothetical protein